MNLKTSIYLWFWPERIAIICVSLWGIVCGQEAKPINERKLTIDQTRIAGISGSEWLLRGGEWSDLKEPYEPEKLAWRKVAIEHAEKLSEFALACLVIGSKIEYGNISLQGFSDPEERLWQTEGIFRMLDGKIPKEIESKLTDFLEMRNWTSPAGGRSMLASCVYFSKSSDVTRLYEIAIDDLMSNDTDNKISGIQLLFAIEPRDPRAKDKLIELTKTSPLESVEFTWALNALRGLFDRQNNYESYDFTSYKNSKWDEFKRKLKKKFQTRNARKRFDNKLFNF